MLVSQSNPGCFSILTMSYYWSIRGFTKIVHDHRCAAHKEKPGPHLKYENIRQRLERADGEGV